MKDILIIAHFTQAPNEKGNGRFHYLAEKISEQNAKVEIVTTSFSHRTKLQRNITKGQQASVTYNFTMLHEPGYKKNVSLSRFYSHYIFGKNLKQYLKKRKKPDVIYCAIPSLDAAKVAATYAKENNIKYIIDVQDLWPEAFKMVFNVPVISNTIFYPMERKADFIYSQADEIIAVSNTYSNRALKVNKKCINAHSIFLGTDLANFDTMAKGKSSLDKPSGEVWLVYLGTLGHSYDINLVIDALKILKDKGHKDIKFIVLGDGPLRLRFENYSKKKDIKAEFTGRLEYGEMVGILQQCDIAVNPISQGAAQSIINKHGDYAAAGLPVLNTQESTEYRNLVDEYQMGFNCKSNDPEDLANKLLQLYDDLSLRESMGNNSRKLAEDKFNRIITYEKIVNAIFN
ncbi:hypothetical protein BTR22_04315 [Alkalihalophilus pseudofirmus]|uniref:glycosyltransferase family 4 protein n=1 Tax=Alkalihalophilus pseudofirmus TaxID=79885 RepID=UPI000950BECA|nr:hypothetical protein BTR22_04315 [Alkalihalophilus pseudofirmus]